MGRKTTKIQRSTRARRKRNGEKHDLGKNKDFEQVRVGGLAKTLHNFQGWLTENLTWPYQGRYVVIKVPKNPYVIYERPPTWVLKLENVIVLGMLTMLKHGCYSIEDPTGSLDLDLSETKFSRGLYTENNFIFFNPSLSGFLEKIRLFDK